jgi:hypothetical protein
MEVLGLSFTKGYFGTGRMMRWMINVKEKETREEDNILIDPNIDGIIL